MSAADQLLAALMKRTRSLRRRLMPRRYKETYLNLVLAQCRPPTTYVEIGVRDGASFRAVAATRRVGIDPLHTEEMATLRPGEEYFEMTSDDFFAGPSRGVPDLATVDVALIDGFHEFRQVVRDFLNLERYMSAEGIRSPAGFAPPRPA